MQREADQARWQQEAHFFDQQASKRLRVGSIEPRVVMRYRSPGELFAKEYCCRLLGDLHGKTVLDLGCGEGENSVLLARLGASVTGLDISPKSLDIARLRARLSGVEGCTEFICAPAEAADLPEADFDVIWGDNILHHVLPVLDDTLAAVMRAAKPGAPIVFIEPTNLNKALRRIRFLVPVHTEVTPGERPLERRDLDVFERHVAEPKRRHFTFLARLTRFLLEEGSYENASIGRRCLVRALHAIDFAILSVPGLESLGGISVLHGRAPDRYRRRPLSAAVRKAAIASL
jgi:2-polyprenyl-3-methyl-5-hydroxy-6-metoxy-1,4-benzoquinol methylase